MAAKKQQKSRKAKYVATTYPNWQHNNKDCEILEDLSGGYIIRFEGDSNKYLVSTRDLEVQE